MSKIFEKRLLIVIGIILLAEEIAVFYPKRALVFSIVSVALLAAALFWLLEIKPKEKRFWPIFILPSVLLFESMIAIESIFAVSSKHLFIFFSCAILYLVIFSLEALKAKIVSYAVIIYNILTLSNLIGAFLGFVLFYNAYTKYSVPLWMGMIAVGVISYLFFMFSLWQNNLEGRDTDLSSLLVPLIMMEFFWVLSFLPLLSLQLGFVLFLIYYIFADLFINEIKRTLSFKIIINHITIPAFVLLFLLFSVKW